MSNAFDKASLVMLPHAYEEGKLYSLKPTDRSGDFTFSRGADTATRVNEQGYIEKGYENLLEQSNSFLTSPWGISSNAFLTSGYSGYDGTNDAWKAQFDGPFKEISQSVSSSGINTFSIYAKAGDTEWIRLTTLGPVNTRVFFNIPSDGNGDIGLKLDVVDASIEYISNGWYRCSVVVSGSISSVRIIGAIGNNNTNTNGEYCYIQDAQLNQGLVSYPYLETTTAPVFGGLTDNMPRLDYTDATCPSLLLEPERTNAIVSSEYLNDSSIAKSNDFEINTSDTTSPEGVNNACKFEFPSGSSRYFGRNVGTLNNATTSVFVKAGTHQYVQYVSSTTTAFTVNFDVANGTSNVVGTLPSGATYDIEPYKNDWYRIWVSQDHGGTAPSVYWWIANDLNTPRAQVVTSAGDMYFYGFQLEQASYPTSYIPTYGSAQTRVADLATDAGNASTFNDSEGVLYAEVKTSAPVTLSANSLILSINDNTNFNEVKFEFFTSNRLYASVRGADGEASTVQTITQTNYNKIAIKYTSSGCKLFVNGVDYAFDGKSISGLNAFSFSRANTTTSPFYGDIKQMLYFPTALSDDELSALTTL